MDFLTTLENKDLIYDSEKYEIENNFKTDKFFDYKKTDNLMAEIINLEDGATVPITAQVHSLDSEARIADRPGYERFELEKLFIKEKINMTERMNRAKRYGIFGNDRIKEFIFNDTKNLVSKIKTRISLMNAELLSTGKVTIDENNVKIDIDYGYNESENTINATDWSNPEHNIIDDIETIKDKAKSKGYEIKRALLSSETMKYFRLNNGIISYFKEANEYVTSEIVRKWMQDKLNIDFVTIDDVYKTERGGESLNVFKKNNISWLTDERTVGKGLYAPTPEENMSKNTSSKGYITLTTWQTEEPCAKWIKASSYYLPVLYDINGLFLSTVS